MILFYVFLCSCAVFCPYQSFKRVPVRQTHRAHPAASEQNKQIEQVNKNTEISKNTKTYIKDNKFKQRTMLFCFLCCCFALFILLKGPVRQTDRAHPAASAQTKTKQTKNTTQKITQIKTTKRKSTNNNWTNRQKAMFIVCCLFLLCFLSLLIPLKEASQTDGPCTSGCISTEQTKQKNK